MNAIKLFCISLLVVGAMLCADVWARGYGHGYHHAPHGYYGHSGFGLYFGLPLYSYPYYSYPYYRYPYSYPYYYPPAVVTVPSTPPVYIEQRKPAAREYPPGYWYYCSDPEGYYPYVKECQQGWQQVEPTPADQR